MRGDKRGTGPRLVSSLGYKNLLPEEKARICNGAGAAGKWISSIIPNTMYGLDCAEAFNIHDYDYEVGVSLDDKDRADRNLLINLLILIEFGSTYSMFFLRISRALKYYAAVRFFGDDAFFKGKHGVRGVRGIGHFMLQNMVVIMCILIASAGWLVF